MKSLKNILGLLPVVAALMLTACSSDDNMTENTLTPAEPTAETKGIPFTVTVSTGDDATTRAVLANDNDPTATDTYLKTLNFAEGDRLYITSAKGHGVLTIKSGAGTNTATFQGTLSETPDADTQLTATLVSGYQYSDIGTANAFVSVDANDAVTFNYPTGFVSATYGEAIYMYGNLTGTALYGTGAPQFTLAQKTVFFHIAITCNYGTYPSGVSAAYLTLKNNGVVLGKRTEIYVSAPWTDGYHHASSNFIINVDNLASLTNATLTIEAGGITAIKTLKDVATIQAKFYNINRNIVSVGEVIGNDGNIYPTKAAAEAATATAEAMVAYVGDATCAHGLAVALDNVKNNGSELLTWDTSGSNNGGKTAQELFAEWTPSHAITGISATTTTGWRIPSNDDWKYMFEGCGGHTYTTANNISPYSYGDFNTMIQAVGGKKMDTTDNFYYWSSTSDQYCYDFYNPAFRVRSQNYTFCRIRPVLAF